MNMVAFSWRVIRTDACDLRTNLGCQTSSSEKSGLYWRTSPSGRSRGGKNRWILSVTPHRCRICLVTVTGRWSRRTETRCRKHRDYALLSLPRWTLQTQPVKYTVKVKVQAKQSPRRELVLKLRNVTCHNEITQCYLPPDTSERAPP